MDLKQVAQGAPYHLATSMKECPFDRFWVVLLDSHIEVYQSIQEEKQDNPWLRLKQFCEDHDTKPINMAWAVKNLDANEQINMTPGADGYFYSKRTRKMWGASDPRWNGYQDDAEGVGELDGNVLTIHWRLDDGRIQVERRELEPDSKHGEPLSLIRT